MDCITTVLLNQNGLNDILWRAKRLDSYQPVERGRTYLSMTRERLPDLSSYEVSLSGISATYKAPGAPSDQLLELFWNTATTFIPRICCDVPQQGKRYNPARRKDLWMTMGYGRFGKGQPPHVGLGIGAVSPGDVDLVFRRDLFQTFIGLIGLQNDISASLDENGALQIDVSGKKVRREQDVERFEWRADRDPLLLALQGGKGTTDADFRHLTVRGFRPSRFTDVVGSLLEHYGRYNILQTELSLHDSGPTYDAMRTHLNQSPLSPWTVKFMASSKYTVDDIDEMIEEAEAVHFLAFRLHPDDIGPVNVELHYTGESFYLTFIYDYKREEQRLALRGLISDLAFGADIIDDTLI